MIATISSLVVRMRPMVRSAALAVAGALVATARPARAARAARPQPTAAARIDSFMVRAVKYGQFNGAILVVANGRTIYERAFGLANMELEAPNTITRRFEIASMTKPMTAIAIMQLV